MAKADDSAQGAKIQELVDAVRAGFTRALLEKPLISLTVDDLLTIVEEVAIQVSGIK